MIRRENRQASFADAFVCPFSANKTLDRIDQIVDWIPLRDQIEKLYSTSGVGQPGNPAIMMFKATLLQQWYDLSDPAAEEAINDRLSFRRFLGLNLSEKGPDHSTLFRFKDRIASIMPALFAEVNRQIDAAGLILRQGTLVDATLIQAAGRPPSSRSEEPPVDPDARWGGKENNLIYGYKGHIGLDEGSEIIRQAEMTPANDHDSIHFKSMISGDESAAYADKAYASQEHSDWLAEQGIEDGILFKASRGHPLTDIQKIINRELTVIRCSVEHVFGTMKRIYHWRRCRHYCYERNRGSFFALCISYNLRRMVKLQES